MAKNFLVYMVIFSDRERDCIYPCYYIGSKTNATFRDGKIYNLRNKEYWGSSEDKTYISLLRDVDVKKHIVILAAFDNYDDMIQHERKTHIKCDVVKSSMFFNKSIALDNNYSNPDYATYKNIETGKIVRLRRDDADVINGIWVGVTAGISASVESNLKRSEWNEKNGNPFKGRKHTDESRHKMSCGVRKWIDDNPDKYEFDKKKRSESVSKAHKGVPKSDEQRRKIGEKSIGKVVLKNIQTGKTVRIDKCEVFLYDEDIWINPYKYAALKGNLEKIECPHCKGIFCKGYMYNRWHNDNCKHKKKEDETDEGK